jgi:hypothetical protein
MGAPLKKGRKPMRLSLCLAATSVFAASAYAAQPAAAPPAASPTAFQLYDTSWTFTDSKGVKVKESIDAKGNYIANSADGKHLDHGTGAMKGDKACFTSAMTKDGEVCWTTHPVRIGHAMLTTSDKGQKLKVTRVAYKPMSIPK